MNKRLSIYLDYLLIIMSISVILSWAFINQPLITNSPPYMSIFTAISLLIMSMTRIAEHHVDTWSKSMSLAMLGIVVGGNLSSITIQLLVPKLFLMSIPNTIPTSNMTSIGIIIFCVYQMLILFRKTPKNTLIIDDLLLHLALTPGGISLLGFALNNPIYISSSIDARVGISLIEMGFMGTFATASLLANPDLFIWKFLTDSFVNKVIFFILFCNQFIAPIIVGKLVSHPTPDTIGIEVFVLLAGTFATLAFLVFHASQSSTSK